MSPEVVENTGSSQRSPGGHPEVDEKSLRRHRASLRSLQMSSEVVGTAGGSRRSPGGHPEVDEKSLRRHRVSLRSLRKYSINHLYQLLARIHHFRPETTPSPRKHKQT